VPDAGGLGESGETVRQDATFGAGLLSIDEMPSMRPRSFALFFTLGILALSCRKSAIPSQFVYLNDCITQGSSLELAMLCLDSIVSDSRCNPNAECFQRGTVVARFTLSGNGQQKTFSLADNTLLPGLGPDTTLLGYHIELLNVQPQPVNPSAPSNSIKAEVLFARQ
jgi:hypothetical protein